MCSFLHTYIRTYIHTYIHTSIHTYIHPADTYVVVSAHLSYQVSRRWLDTTRCPNDLNVKAFGTLVYNKDLSRHTLVSQASSGDMLMVENMQLRLKNFKEAII